MNILITTDAYHITMGSLIKHPLEIETHVLYARRGGPLVVPNLREVLGRLVSALPSRHDVLEAASYWRSQQVMFPKQAWLDLVAMDACPITIRGVRDGEIVLPGEPIAMIESPAILAGVIEPFLIGEMMASIQWATRFTKVASAVNWDDARIFEVGLRAAPSAQVHKSAIAVLTRVGLRMSSHGGAARNVKIASGGTMGHRYTQRFSRDIDAFKQAIEQVLAYRKSENITGKSKLSLLLDTRNTMQQGLPAALQIIQTFRDEIRQQIQLSIRFDSGDLEAQLKASIALIKSTLVEQEDWPDIILESGLTAQDVARFEAIALKAQFPRRKLLYGLGGYLVGGINRDTISMVYKLTSFNGIATMKFGDDIDAGKTSYPGRFTLMERSSKARIERCVVHDDDISTYMEHGWNNVFIDLVVNGKLVARPVSDDYIQQWIALRWDLLAKGYIGDETAPAIFPRRPRLSTGLQALIAEIRAEQLYQDEVPKTDFINHVSDVLSLTNVTA